jgi:hypothetical protein
MWACGWPTTGSTIPLILGCFVVAFLIKLRQVGRCILAAAQLQRRRAWQLRRPRRLTSPQLERPATRGSALRLANVQEAVDQYKSVMHLVRPGVEAT